MTDTIDVSALRGLVAALTKDLQKQVKTDEAQVAKLQAAWRDAKTHERTGLSLAVWKEEYLTQVAVGWVLTTLFVRYLEDHELIQPTLVGEVAQGHQRAYFQQEGQLTHSDTDYLLFVFNTLAKPPAGELFRPERNPLHKHAISGDAAMALLEFFRGVDPDSGELRFDFRAMDTRFLGDVYQDLSEDIRKKYALLQTPDFVEDFILDLTLEPAIEAFGLDEVRFIDPTCGSGHFLLGGFKRLVAKKRQADATKRIDVIVREALQATHGVDINPFAVTIARFRLLAEAFELCGIKRWDTQVSFPLRIAVGDSLILGRHFPRFETSATNHQQQLEIDHHRMDDLYTTEDNDLIFGDGETPGILMQQYHAVVGNPPYITVKDPGLRDIYKKHYASCYMQYSLVCPFYERFFELAIGHGLNNEDKQLNLHRTIAEVTPGFVSLIVSNAFMKRSYGKKLITKIIPNTDITHVIDTSGAYIPGHGTPTVILAGRNRQPASDKVRAILGIRGEPSTPKIPREGKVWSSIANHVHQDDFENDFVTIGDQPREMFEFHPWSLQGGGALKCKAFIEDSTEVRLVDNVTDLGFICMTRADDLYFVDQKSLLRKGFDDDCMIVSVTGEVVRNWSLSQPSTSVFPYDRSSLIPKVSGYNDSVFKFLWPHRTHLWLRREPNGNHKEIGLTWYEWSRFQKKRFRVPLTITYAEVASHNHFVLNRGGKVFSRTAPVIKLPVDATEDDHLELLGLLNSSTSCFWMKQVFFNKGLGSENWSDRYQRDVTKIKKVPISKQKPLKLAKLMDALAQKAGELEPARLSEEKAPTPAHLNAARKSQEALHGQMVAFQEELDWRCYELYSLLKEGEAPLVPNERWDEVPDVKLGERAFEVVLARKMEAGDVKTSWFERHGSAPITEVPERWPKWYQEVVEARIDMIDEKRFIRLIEDPKYKRRWRRDGWDVREKSALQSWLLDRLESPSYVPQADRNDGLAHESGQVVTVRQLADVAAKDEDWMMVAQRYTGDPNFEVEGLVKTLVMSESVPFLPTQRYKPSGLARRKEWEAVWVLQRQEDQIDARVELEEDNPRALTSAEAEALKASEVGEIGKPPNYRQSDFLPGPTYSLRGKLDVPKERFVWLKGCALDDKSPALMWAGLDHRQRAMALVAYYQRVKMQEGWEAERLALLLAGLKDLLPWVKQWHNQLDPRTRTKLGDFLGGFIEAEARGLNLGLELVERVRIDSLDGA